VNEHARVASATDDNVSLSPVLRALNEITVGIAAAVASPT
jgi:hypothetical protein